MNGDKPAFEPAQSFAYEIKKDSAVIRRCFSLDTKAEIPKQLDGYPVTEIAPYAFSAHLDEGKPSIRNSVNLKVRYRVV